MFATHSRTAGVAACLSASSASTRRSSSITSARVPGCHARRFQLAQALRLDTQLDQLQPSKAPALFAELGAEGALREYEKLLSVHLSGLPLTHVLAPLSAAEVATRVLRRRRLTKPGDVDRMLVAPLAHLGVE